MASGLLGLYWKERKAGLQQCAAAVHDSLSCMVGHGYGQFFETGKSRRDARTRRFDVSSTSVEELLAKGVNRTDIGRQPIPELGWSMSLWSGDADDEAYSVSFHCGGFSRHVGNNVVIRLPASGRHSLAEAPDRAIAIYRDLVRIWNPEQAVLCEGNISWDRGLLVPGSQPLAQRKLGLVRRLLARQRSIPAR